MTLGEYIIEYRQAHGLSQRQFAKQCDLTNGYINMIEAGINPKTKQPIVPSIASYKKIAQATGKSLHDLLSVIDDAPIQVNDLPSNYVDRSNDILRFALFGDAAEGFTDEQLKAVRDYAAYIRQKGSDKW